MSLPTTPQKRSDRSNPQLHSLNSEFCLDLPIGVIRTPRHSNTAADLCLDRLNFLDFRNKPALAEVIEEFRQRAGQLRTQWVHKARQESGALPEARRSEKKNGFLHSGLENGVAARDDEERALLLETLNGLLEGPVEAAKKIRASDMSSPKRTGTTTQSPTKRRLNGAQEVFQTAPCSPTPSRCATSSVSTSTLSTSTSSTPTYSLNDDNYDGDGDDGDESYDPDIDFDSLSLTDSFLGDNQTPSRKEKQPKIDAYYNPSKTRDLGAKDERNSPSKVLHPHIQEEKQQTVGDYMTVSKAGVSRPDRCPKSDLTRQMSETETSFGTTTASYTSGGSSFTSGRDTAATSFNIDANRGDVPPAKVSDAASPKALPVETDTTGPTEPADENNEFKIQKIVRDLEMDGPFAKRKASSSTVPFRYRYEAQRIADAHGIAPREISLEEFPCDYSQFWDYLRGKCPNRPKCQLLKTTAGPWEMAVEQYRDTVNNTDDVVIISGTLDWKEKSESESARLKFAPNPLRFERTNRFCRRFGSDRFFDITLKPLPGHLRKRFGSKSLWQATMRWLASCDHYIAGRVWRAFFLEPVKENPGDNKVYLFAVDGNDFIQPSSLLSPAGEDSDRHTQMSVKSLINWHIPLSENSDQKDCKLFNRMRLALSRALPTVVILPEQTRVLECGGVDMSDGCALMSRPLGNSVAQSLGLDIIPSCFQARIAGAKGIWMVDRDNSGAEGFEPSAGNVWIQIRGSQLKIYPHPFHGKAPLDNDQMTFEVISWSKPLSPARLSKQLLMILQHGGVPRYHIENLIKQEISEFYREFKEVVMSDNSVACRRWLQSKGYEEAPKRKSRRFEGFPASRNEQACLLVENGLLPLKVPFLMRVLRNLLETHLNQFKKLKIQLPDTTYAYCIADPYQVLGENEVHLSFSRPWADMDGRDVLVARSPAHRASDIQKRKAVYHRELRHFQDVIVFPTTGNVPLASLLSGGDYDGDEVWICWDPVIVNSFRNTEPRAGAEAADLGLVNHSGPMDQLGILGEEESLNEFLTKMFTFNSLQSRLGLCSNEYEKLCYHRNSIDFPDANDFADLLGHLVDAAKAGDELPEKQWSNLRRQWGLNGLHTPAYKNDRPGGIAHKPENIIDYLMFEVVKSQADSVLNDFEQLGESQGKAADPVLKAEWSKVWDQAVAENNDGSPSFLGAVVGIKEAVLRGHKTWGKTQGRLSYAEGIRKAAELLEEIQPPPLSPEGAHHWVQTWHNFHESWIVLRASCAYNYFPVGAFSWYAAGSTLCRIKADSSGGVRTAIAPVYATFKVDRKAAKRQLEDRKSDESGESDDDGVDEDEDVVKANLGLAGDDNRGLEEDAGSAGSSEEYLDAKEALVPEVDSGDTEPDIDFDDTDDDWTSLP